MSTTTEKQMRPVHVTNKTAPSVPGRRSFFTYRDLGVTDATQGAMRAQITEAVTGMTEPTGWHYHVCEAQLVYILKGWVDLEFETGEEIRVQAGESLFIPGGLRHNELSTSVWNKFQRQRGLRHNELSTSDDLELLEISTPADRWIRCRASARPSCPLSLSANPSAAGRPLSCGVRQWAVPPAFLPLPVHTPTRRVVAQFEFPFTPTRRVTHPDSDWRLASRFGPSRQPPNPPCQGGFRKGPWVTRRFPPDKGGKGGYMGVRWQDRFETDPLPPAIQPCQPQGGDPRPQWGLDPQIPTSGGRKSRR